MIEKRHVGTQLTRATVLVCAVSWIGTAVFAKPPKGEEQMPLSAPPIQGRVQTERESEEQSDIQNAGLNASQNRPSFSLNATRFKQGVDQTDTQLSSGAPKFDVSAFQQQPLAGGVQALRLLANYNIELIVDESMSMRRMDCPGGLSRWNWCGMQAGQLAKQLAPFVRNGFTLTTFAGDYNVYNNSTPDNVMHLFQNPMFSLGTRMAAPLEDRLNTFFSRQGADTKPLLLAVITDGCPAPKRQPMMVADTLIRATRRMRDPGDVTVVFFQIGGADYKGQRFLSYLDTGLVADGARFDIVKNVPMERLQQIGLAQSLVDSIHDFAAKSKLPSKL